MNSSLDPEAVPFTGASQEASNRNVQGERNFPGLCPVQKVKIKDTERWKLCRSPRYVRSWLKHKFFISKNVKKKLGLGGTKTHLTMTLARSNKKSEESELINISVVSTAKEHIQKSMRVYAINKPCSPARTVSRKIVNSYPHLKAISNKLYLSGGTVDLLIATQIIDGRVQVRMPWKDEGPPKESNYDIAYKKMISSEKTFRREDCLEVIQDQVQKLLEKGFVKEVPPEQINHETSEWYLLLQADFTPDRTTKVRLVFDASAQGRDGKSLNDHLDHQGPNYINSLPNVFIAWRFDKEGYTVDVRKLFNQVKIHPDDRVFHHFLWRTSDTEQPRVYQWLRLNFGDKPAPDIAAAAINTLAKASEAQYPEAAKELRTHVYVHDIGGSRESEAKCKQVTSELDSDKNWVTGLHNSYPRVIAALIVLLELVYLLYGTTGGSLNISLSNNPVFRRKFHHSRAVRGHRSAWIPLLSAYNL